MQIKILTLNTVTDETTIQDWLDDHPSARILSTNVSGLYAYIFYVE